MAHFAIFVFFPLGVASILLLDGLWRTACLLAGLVGLLLAVRIGILIDLRR